MRVGDVVSTVRLVMSERERRILPPGIHIADKYLPCAPFMHPDDSDNEVYIPLSQMSQGLNDNCSDDKDKDMDSSSPRFLKRTKFNSAAAVEAAYCGPLQTAINKEYFQGKEMELVEDDTNDDVSTHLNVSPTQSSLPEDLTVFEDPSSIFRQGGAGSPMLPTSSVVLELMQELRTLKPIPTTTGPPPTSKANMQQTNVRAARSGVVSGTVYRLTFGGNSSARGIVELRPNLTSSSLRQPHRERNIQSLSFTSQLGKYQPITVDKEENVNPQPSSSKKSLPSFDGTETYCHRCKNDHCLRKYCACRSEGNYCGQLCTCQHCKNRPGFESDEDWINAERRRLRQVRKKHKKKGEVGRCNCKNTACLKKYCVCHKANTLCTTECRCDGCENC